MNKHEIWYHPALDNYYIVCEAGVMNFTYENQHIYGVSYNNPSSLGMVYICDL